MGDVKRTDDKKNSDAPDRDAAATDEQESPNGCCGGPAPPGVDACCALDAAVKSEGGTGCGCAARFAKEAKRDT